MLESNGGSYETWGPVTHKYRPICSSSSVGRLITPAPVHMVPNKRVYNDQFERNLMHPTGREGEEEEEEEILFSRVSSSLQKQRHDARPSMLFG